jgi:hypothetical protein
VEQDTPTELLFDRDSEIVSLISGCYHAGVITKLGTLHVWGMRGRPGILGDDKNIFVPTVMEFPSVKWARPLWSHDRMWELLVRWLFLGREDEMSNLSVLPIEVIFNFTVVLLGTNL